MQAMFKKPLLLALVLPILATSAAAAPSTPAPSVETMQLSSWQSEVVEGSIVGGVQTVTIVSTAVSSAQSVAFLVETPPCKCNLATVAASDGIFELDLWTIDELQPGESATLELTYVGDQ
jgi:hypothetical protein